jgi:hypothetical protein
MSKFAGVFQSTNRPDIPQDDSRSPQVVPKGRPKGKRSDPAFEQVTAYIRRETYLQTKMLLLQEGNQKDFSQLVEELLGAYARTQKGKLPDK